MASYKYDPAIGMYVLVDDFQIIADPTLAATSVSTDQPDYAPGSTAYFTANVGIGDVVTFEVLDVDGDPISGTNAPWTVRDGGAGDLDGVANGVVQTSWSVGLDAAGESFVLRATDETAGVMVTTSFTDSNGTPTTNISFDTQVDLSAVQSTAEVNGVHIEQILQGSTPSSGTGIFPSFLRIHNSGNGGTEQGYNTDGDTKPSTGAQDFQFDQVAGNFTHSVQLGQMAVVSVDGHLYREFRLDLGENVNNLISLDVLKLYWSGSATLKSYDPITALGGGNTAFGGSATPIWDMDAGSDGDVTLKLNDLSSGNGHPDYTFLVPNELFAGISNSSYIYLYSAFGGVDGERVDGTFEEWSYRATANGAISINKITGDGPGGIADGDGVTLTINDPVVWTYTVTNTGNVALSNVTVTDDHLGVTPTFDHVVLGNNDAILDPGEVWVFTATGTVVDTSLLPGGVYTNVGTASGTYQGQVFTAQDPSSYVSGGPVETVDLTLTKDTLCLDDQGQPEHSIGAGGTILSGSPIEWVYTLTNPVDSPAGPPVTNVTLTDTITDAAHPLGITVTIYGNGQLDPNGDLAALGYTVDTNFGDVGSDKTLSDGETWTFTVKGAATAGDYSNIADASGTSSGANPAPSAESETNSYFGATAGVSIEKQVSFDHGTTWLDADTVAGQKLVLVGSDVWYQVLVTNTTDANLSLDGVDVSDNTGIDFKFAGLQTVDIAAGQTATSDTYKTTVAKGQESDTASVIAGTVTDDCGNTATPTAHDDANYFGAAPSMSIDKYIVCEDGTFGPFGKGSDTTVPKLLSGDVNYVIAVTNTGNVTLDNLLVTDLSGLTLTLSQTLSTGAGDLSFDQGDVWVYTAVGTWAKGTQSNTAEATASFTDSLGQTADKTNTAALDVKDTVSYFGIAPHITLTKLTNGSDGPTLLQGQAITWTYDVYNDGNVDLTGVSVSDNPSQSITGVLITSGQYTGYNTGDTDHDGVLDQGETWHFKATGSAIDTSSLPGGIYSNLATATTADVTDSCGDTVPVCAKDGSSYTGLGRAVEGLTKGYWATHATLWDVVNGDEKGAGAEINSFGVNPPGITTDWNKDGSITQSTVATKGAASGLGLVSGNNNGGGDSGLLMGDLNHDGLVTGDGSAHHLFLDLASAQALTNSSVVGDARIILAGQAVAAQLNEYQDYVMYGHDTSPNGLISEAVDWLLGQGPMGNSKSNIDTVAANNKGPAPEVISDSWGSDYTLKGGAITLGAPALSSSDPAWQTKVLMFSESTFGFDVNHDGDTKDTVYANGEGLKNALAAYNHGLSGGTQGFVTSQDGSLIGWESSIGGTPVDVFQNKPDVFWGILANQNVTGVEWHLA
ncbi:hypothetical protein JQ617_38145 [Bradyrhizobium sp. KB893862 SZCCT0404]|uniref:DUF7507 domain-containing protein n=1 Tax=Bradyrhizobium sp. KB893862 SZCCT0404 TaxID=2807672 RepID=UPI001BAB52C6|nr:hypothetical protein [Bradyrhizobium sp. KB893862 SZCCT0404]MBR1179841.1 hypothetical protein [Bradyrhizobium sp. KB893862 SZCCT0404]